MDKTNSTLTVLILLVLVVIAELVVSIYHIGNYDSQKAAGNAKWQQVEERLLIMENKIENLEK